MRGASGPVSIHIGALAAVVALSVGGCNRAPDGPEPTVDTAPTTTEATPTVATSADPTPSPTPAPPLRPVPPEAMELSEAGALAFLDWWVEMYNYVEATGETDLVFEHSEPSCTICRNFVERVEPIYRSGRSIDRSSPTIITDASVQTLDTNNFAVLAATISAGPSRVLANNGDTESQSVDSPPMRILAGIQWTNNRWQLADIGPEAT